jgi:Na+/proline symporter/HPt (histidine-containing phosphotransfer) domain-containing protein
MRFSAAAVLATIIVYVAALFAVARWGEESALGKRVASHPLTFAVGLSVYCTTWTFFGSVGRAATAGMQYLPIYLGPTVGLLFGWTTFRRIAELKHAHRLTSIADFLSARYGKSQRLAALVTATLAVGIIPYIALQMRSLMSCFAAMTGDPSSAHWFGPVLVVLMTVFTIAFGIRHLDPTERHPGMLVAVGAEGIVKLVAFLAVGVFVFVAAFPSAGAFFTQLDAVGATLPTLGPSSGNDLLTFAVVTLMSAAAFSFLPRQFHQGIIENSDPDAMRTAGWVTPLYLLVINLFVVPIAIGGRRIALAGTSPDLYVLAIPLQAGQGALSMAVFIGGLSAALGMVIIETMTMATMISNHLVIPLATRVRPLAGLRSRLLYVRWAAAGGLLVVAWQFADKLGGSQMLVSIGLISFAAACLLAPVMLGALYWREASERGVLVGLGAGFVLWFYTLMVPTFVRSHWLSQTLLTEGPFGVAWLKPEALLGMTGLPSLVHGVMVSTAACIVGYVGFSIALPPTKDEALLTEAFLDVGTDQIAHLDSREATVEVDAVVHKAEAVFAEYMAEAEAGRRVAQAISDAVGERRAMVSAVEQAAMLTSLERTLAGVIGSACAFQAMKPLGKIERKNRRELEREFARALADLRINPRDLKRRIDFEQEKARLLEEQFHALEEKNDGLEQKVEERTRELRAILDNVVFGFLVVARDLTVGDGRTRSCAELLATDVVTGRRLPELLRMSDAEELAFQLGVEQLFDDLLPEDLAAQQLPQRFEQPGGRVIRAEARAVRDERGAVSALLFTLSDVTRLEAAEHENEENRAILNIVRQRSAFEAFLDETKAHLSSARAAITTGDDVTVRREAHTIKGNAATYGVSSVVRVVHEVEEHPIIVESHLDEIHEAFRGFLDAHASVLGVSMDHERARTWTVTEGDIDVLARVASTLGDEERAPLEQWLREVTLVPARDLLGPVEELVASVADRRGKSVTLTVDGGDVRMDTALTRRVLQSTVHLLRNCVDHGIEEPEGRGAKATTGTIRFSIAASPSEYTLRISDDGRGIDGDAVARSAVGRGVLTEDEAARLTPAEKVALIFADSVSTASEVSDISGRGVGMSAVKADIEAVGGRIVVDTVLEEGTTFTLTIPRPPRVTVRRWASLRAAPRASAPPAA